MTVRPRFILARSMTKEMAPTFVMATGVSTFLLIIRALFNLADLFIARDVPTGDALKLLVLSLPHVLVLTIPIGTLFAVLMTAARLSADSELVALQACGIRLWRVARPILAAGIAVLALDLWLTAAVMPEANRELERLRVRLALSGAKAAIDPRVFIEFPGRTLYINRIDRSTGRWSRVLLFDQTTPNEDRLVVADSGELLTDPRDGNQWLVLRDAVTHQLQPDAPDKYRRNTNQELTINLTPPAISPDQIRLGVRSTDTAALIERLDAPTEGRSGEKLDALIELHKRVAIPAASLVFALVGFPLGIRNRRGGKSFGLTASVLLVVLYYILLNNGELLARTGKIPVALGIWLANTLLAALGIVLLARVSRGALPVTTATAWWWQRLALVWKGLARPLAESRRDQRTAATSARQRSCVDDEGRSAACAPPLVSTIDRYLIRHCLGFFALVLVAISAIYVVVSLTEEIDDIQKHAVPLIVVITNYAFMLPQIFHDILPVGFLISFLGTAAILERHNETTALKAAGISLGRLAVPLLVLAGVLGASLFILDDSVVQKANRAYQRTNDIIKGRSGARTFRTADSPWLFLPDGRTLVNFLQFDRDTNTLVRPSVYVFDDQLNLRARYMAARATYTNGQWLATGAWSRTLPLMADQEANFVRHRGTLQLPIPAEPSYFSREYRKPSQMSFTELRDWIVSLRAAGYRVDRQTVQLHLKLAYPLSVLILAWLALPFAFRIGRRGAVMGIALALMLGAAYLVATAFVTKLGEAGLLPPVLAAWTPTAIFALLAINRGTTLRT